MTVNERQKLFNSKIRDWYVKAYPTDNLGEEISDATFVDLFDALDNYLDVYKLLGVGDSLIRERCFEKLAEIIDEDYGYVYEQWMLGCDMR